MSGLLVGQAAKIWLVEVGGCHWWGVQCHVMSPGGPAG